MEINKIDTVKRMANVAKLEEIKSPSEETLNQILNLENQASKLKMHKSEFAHLMKNRPLIKYRPAKNSFVKKGDKALLSTGLGIDAKDIEPYVNELIQKNFEIGQQATIGNLKKEITSNEIELTKTYVYRHGKKEQVLAYLSYELSDVKRTLKNLYQTFNEENEGVFNYYSRPCHILSNSDAKSMYDIIEKRLDTAYKSGNITEQDKLDASKYSLEKIYKIQNNPDVRQAFRIVWENT